jgi:hypothetical protein
MALGAAQGIQFYGYGSMSVPVNESDSTYVLSWVRVGMKGNLAKKDFRQLDQFTYKFEGDIMNQSMKYAHLNRTSSFDSSELTLTVGKFLTPVGYLYNGPKTQRHVKWAETLTNFSVYGIGLMVSLTPHKYPVTLRLASYGEKVLAFSSAYKYLNLFWEKDIGAGAIISSGGVWNEYVGTVSFGYAKFDNQDNVWSLRHEVPTLAVNVIFSADIAENRDDYAVSISYEFMKNSYVKFGWQITSLFDDQTDQWTDHDQFVLNLMFSSDQWK